MIVRLAGAKSQHVATKAQMLLALDCMQPQVFDWCDGVVRWVRAELTACKTHTQREFGYGTLIVSFLLEWIPLMRPRIVTAPLGHASRGRLGGQLCFRGLERVSSATVLMMDFLIG